MDLLAGLSHLKVYCTIDDLWDNVWFLNMSVMNSSRDYKKISTRTACRIYRWMSLNRENNRIRTKDIDPHCLFPTI
ncbi:hypothetical protein Glove_213g219 [Diversispora epigaea]|uniref:Uncharacterized protein n=1 Tax=Diversispora epigaea TaxID=1348612 RepID=A0A397IHY1_9GLOM|nr:hypothetical protein Glove_213g219 [Diversispora epigaea]